MKGENASQSKDEKLYFTPHVNSVLAWNVSFFIIAFVGASTKKEREKKIKLFLPCQQ